MKNKSLPAYREIAEIARCEGIIPSVPQDEADLIAIVHKLFEHIGIITEQFCDDTSTLIG